MRLTVVNGEDLSEDITSKEYRISSIGIFSYLHQPVDSRHLCCWTRSL